MDVNKLHKGFTTNPCRLHNIWCSNPSFILHPKVVAEEDVVVAEAMEAAQVVTSSSNLLNDTQYQVLPLQNPGLELTMLSGDPLHCFPCNPSREGEDSECVIPTGEGKDSVCTVPTRGGENSGCTVSETPNLVQFKSVFIQEKDLPVGGRLRQFLPEWEKHGSHQLITGLIKDGYKLPFRERPNLSRVPCIISSYAGFDKQNALWTSIQDLLQKGAVEVVHTPESVGFYSRLFLVPKPGNRWRPVIDLSSLN